MYIQKINIKNFKSFKEETIIPFCQGLTVVTGANASGKTNLIDSIRFILCDLEDVSKNIINDGEKECAVEIIFETEEERVILGRKIAKDNDNSLIKVFFINRLKVSKESYEDAVQKLSCITVDKEFVREVFAVFETKVKTSKIYISDDIFCCFHDKKAEEIGKFLKENAKDRQIIVVSHNEKMVRQANSILEIPQKAKNYDLMECIKSKINPEISKSGKESRFFILPSE